MSERSMLTESTKRFIRQLNRNLQKKAPYEIKINYEQDFEKLASTQFKASSFPTAASIKSLVDEDENFLVLYKQLYFRHLFVKKLSKGLQPHFASFQNFIELFNILLGLTTEAPEFEIPAVWCWDMIDEFVYQFSTFHAYRNRADLSEEEKQMLEESPHEWSPVTVVRFLLSFADKGGVSHGDDSSEEKSSEGAPHKFFKTLGVFALIGMLKVNCLMGDYTSAVNYIKNVDLTGRHESMYVWSAYASYHYHLSFAHLASRRYADAIRVGKKGLRHLHRNRGARTYQDSNVVKMKEQMFGILAIAASLVPQRLDDGMYNQVMDRYGQQVERMRNMDIDAYREVFVAVCPKFIPMRMQADMKTNSEEGLQLQLAVFLDEVRATRKVPEIYSYLKMCTTMNTERLASFLGVKEEELTPLLLYVKHKTQSGSKYTAVSKSEKANDEKETAVLEGVQRLEMEKVSTSGIQFTVSNNLVEVTEHKKSKLNADYFIRQILRYEDVIDIEKSKRQRNDN
mmetsp:Transcript_3847/g.5141  ORF Transcript_3847/g.5141 Transcript_3847/m.5141 type:complete len:511 (+) Transcript_3847:127-1659(+)